MIIPPSELLLTPEGKIYHLNLAPEQIADTIILVGDPGRVEMIGKFLSDIEFREENREFVTITGYFNEERITVMSTGIGVGNIDIAINELDALVNIDLATRTIKEDKKSLNLIRIGTSGSLQPDIPVGSYIISEKAVGLDGLLNFHEGRNAICDLEFEKALHLAFPELNHIMKTYTVESSALLLKMLQSDRTHSGVTLTAPGFYGSQGRELRLGVAMKGFNDKVEAFEFNGQKITNYEMETSALLGYAKLLGHEAITICLAIANRPNKNALKGYHQEMKDLVEYTLNRICNG